jgi:hypothetical protein
LEAARLLGESLSHARKIAGDELSRRSPGNKPWTIVRDGLEKLVVWSNRPSSAPTDSGAPRSVRLVAAADKLHNARSILKDLRVESEAAWRRFNAGREDQLWYYRALVDALREAGGLEDLVEELDEVVREIKKVEA